MVVENNRVVTITYTVSDEGGNVIEDIRAGDGMEYIHGSGKMIPAVEKSLDGKEEGSTLVVPVDSTEAFGDWREDLALKIPKGDLESADSIEIGERVEVDYQGSRVVLPAVAVDEEYITLDGNHPLAGKSLIFDVTIKQVRDATPEELERVSGHGGCGGSCGGATQNACGHCG